MAERFVSWKMNVFLLVVAFVAITLATVSDLETRAYFRCQARVNEATSIATTARSDAAKQDRASDRAESQATAQLIQGVFRVKTAEEFRAVYATYTKDMAEIDQRRAAAERQRQANPLPPPPSETCG